MVGNPLHHRRKIGRFDSGWRMQIYETIGTEMMLASANANANANARSWGNAPGLNGRNERRGTLPPRHLLRWRVYEKTRDAIEGLSSVYMPLVRTTWTGNKLSSDFPYSYQGRG